MSMADIASENGLCTNGRVMALSSLTRVVTAPQCDRGTSGLP